MPVGSPIRRDQLRPAALELCRPLLRQLVGPAVAAAESVGREDGRRRGDAAQARASGACAVRGSAPYGRNPFRTSEILVADSPAKSKNRGSPWFQGEKGFRPSTLGFPTSGEKLRRAKQRNADPNPTLKLSNGILGPTRCGSLIVQVDGLRNRSLASKPFAQGSTTRRDKPKQIWVVQWGDS